MVAVVTLLVAALFLCVSRPVAGVVWPVRTLSVAALLSVSSAVLSVSATLLVAVVTLLVATLPALVAVTLLVTALPALVIVTLLVATLASFVVVVTCKSRSEALRHEAALAVVAVVGRSLPVAVLLSVAVVVA